MYLTDHTLDNSGWLFKHEDQRTHEVPLESNPFRFAWYPFDHSATIPPDMNNPEIPAPSNWREQAQWRVNIPALLRFGATENFITNTDGAVEKMNNYWYYDWSTEPNDDPNFQQPRLYFGWDLDTIMKSQDTNWDIIAPEGAGGSGHLWHGLIRELDESGTPFAEPTFQADYLSIYNNLMDGPLALSNTLALVNSIEPVISAAMDADPYQQTGSAAAEFQRIRDFLTDRTASVNAQLDALSPLPGITLLDDGFEATPWDANWTGPWVADTTTYHGGSTSAHADKSNSGDFTCDALDTDDANAVYVRFWIQKKNVSSYNPKLYYYNGTSYVDVCDLDTLGADNGWILYNDTITDSNYFTPDFRIRFSASLGGGGAPRHIWVDDVEIAKTVAVVQRTLTTSSTLGGSVTTPGEGPYQYDHGTDANIVATADPNYQFVNWTGTGVTAGKVADPNAAATTITMDADYTAVANFELTGPTQHTLTTSSTAGGTVTTPGEGPYQYDHGTDANIVAAPDTNYHFVNWTGTGADAGKVADPCAASTTITMDNDYTAIANFAIDQRTLTTSSTLGGSVTTPGEGPYQYDHGTDANIVASPDVGFYFLNWTGTGVDADKVADPNAASTTITMDGDYTAVANFATTQYTISGNAGVASATMTGLPSNPVSDGSGNYSDTVDYGWSGTVTPTKAGYTFTPPSMTYTSVAEDHIGDNYTPTPNTYTISGTVGTLAGVTMTGLPGDPCTDGSGFYTATVDYGFSGTVTPAKAGYTFTPPSMTYTSVAEDHIGDNYTPTPNTYTISGTVGTLAGVTMTGLPGDPCTDGSGFYTATVDYGWSGTVTPTKYGYTFEPNSLTYDNVIADQTNQDYQAVCIFSDDFNDNSQGTTWQLFEDDHEIVHLEEVNQRLEVIAVSGPPDLASYCVGHWKMNDDANNTTVVDSSGNGNHGTAQRNTEDINDIGKIAGALTFNGTSDFVAVGDVTGAGAYTKVVWIKRADGDFYNNIFSSDAGSHALWAPYHQSFKLTAGHNDQWYIVQDSNSLEAGLWYQVAVTFDPDVESGKMVLYKNAVAVDDANNVPTQISSTETYIGKFAAGYNFGGTIDNVMIFNKALTAEEIELLYNEGNGTETIPAGSQDITAVYASNGWSLDTEEDFALEVDFHYSSISSSDGWVGITIENGDSYVSISAGSDSNESYFYYEALVDGNTVVEQEPRGSDDGTLYISYDAGLNSLYLSSVGYGSANAYVWQTISNPLQGQWASEPADVVISGGSDGVALSSGQAYLDNFIVVKGTFRGWLSADFDNDEDVDFDDFAALASAWQSSPGQKNWISICDISDPADDVIDILDLATFTDYWLGVTE